MKFVDDDDDDDDDEVKMLKVEGARAPVPYSWRHHWETVTACVMPDFSV